MGIGKEYIPSNIFLGIVFIVNYHGMLISSSNFSTSQESEILTVSPSSHPSMMHG